jgi:signal transduction histidine kinase
VLDVPPGAGQGAEVVADAGALEQLLLNLLLNAADALPPRGRAGVQVEATPMTVRLVVWDQGEGMTPASRDRALEPFFSTKDGGTGLGLPIANRIALAHGAALEIASERGQGTRVTVSLRPAYPGQPRGAGQGDRP